MADDGGRSRDLDGNAAVVGRPGRPALVGEAAEVLLRRRGRSRHREGGAEVRREVRQRDPVLRAARPRDRRLDAREIELEPFVEDRSVARFAPQALGLRVALHERDPFGRSAGEPEIRQGLVVDREERRGRAELGTHVADRRPVGQRQRRQAIAREFDERPHDAVGAEHLRDDQHEVRRGRAAWQRPVEADADDVRHRLVERLAEEDRLGLDPADAVPEDAQAVDHRRVRVGPDDRIRECHPAAAPILAVGHDRGEELQVDLVDDAGPGRHDPEIAEGGLGPAQELVALTVAVVFALDVERERARRPELVDLDGMVDDEIGRHQWVDPCGVAAEVGHRVAHDREVHDRGDAREILEEDPRGHERDLRLRCRPGPPGEQRLDVLAPDDAAAGVAEQVLEQDLDRDRQ